MSCPAVIPSLTTKIPPPKIARLAAKAPNVSVNGLALAITFSCLKFKYLTFSISFVDLLSSKLSALKDLTCLAPLKISSRIDASSPT